MGTPPREHRLGRRYHGGVTALVAPDGSEIRLIAGAPEGATRASLCEATLAAGQTSRPVRHRSVEEIWLFTEGEGRVWRCPPDAADPVSVAPVAVHAGVALVIKTGWSFQFQASAAGPLRFLCYTSPPWPGDDEAEPVAHGGLGLPSV